MRLKFLLLAAAGVLLTVAACKKKTTTDDQNQSIDGKTKQEVFMMQKWKIGSWTDSNSNTGKVDAMDDCIRVHSYNFNTTTNYVLDRHTCTNGDPQTETLGWSMSSPNATQVTFSGWGTYTIVKQTAQAITLQREIVLLGYNTLEVVTFGKY